MRTDSGSLDDDEDSTGGDGSRADMLVMEPAEGSIGIDIAADDKDVVSDGEGCCCG